MKTRFLIYPVAVAAMLLAGCTSTEERAAVTTGAAATAGGVTALATKGKSWSPYAAAGAASVAAGAAQLAQGEDESTYQKGYRDGYELGQSDAIKRQWWMQQNMQKWGAQPSARTVYYTMPGPETRFDGQKLTPQDITVPVIESK